MKRTPMKRGKPLDRKPMRRKPVRLNQRSAKRADEYARPGGRRDLVAAMLAARPRCEARVLCRGARAVDVHERLSRARGGSILDPEQAHMVTACRACHDWITQNPKAAEALRLLLSAWHKCPPVGPC